MHDKLQAFNQNKTWSIFKLPKEKYIVGIWWVYKTKFNSNGFVDKHKARLIAKRYTQTFGIDYKETFAPVVKINIVHVLLSVALNNRWLMCQMDVKNVLLHENLEKEVYMKLSSGHPQSSNPTLVCWLHKSIYGLKKFPCVWGAQLSNVLKEIGFKRSNIDFFFFFCSSWTKGEISGSYLCWWPYY